MSYFSYFQIESARFSANIIKKLLFAASLARINNSYESSVLSSITFHNISRFRLPLK